MIRNALLALLDLAAVCCVSMYGIWAMLPHFCGRYDSALAAQTPACEYRDRNGNRLLLNPTYDYQYRLDVPLRRVSNQVQRMMLAVEDRRFHQHDGVDRLAALRSLWMNVRHGAVMSGASTVTMQLAGMVMPRSRSIARKLLQAGYARNLEWRHGKNWIFENYLNRVPFGGKIYGIEAAGRHYFGCPAANLNQAEATLLCGLPQRPSAYRPDRHYAAARRRQRMVLWMLAQNGGISQEDMRRIYCDEPLRLRNFTIPSPLLQRELARTDHYLRQASRQAGPARTVQCALDMEMQRMLLETLRSHVRRLDRVRDGAGVILDNRTCEVLAMVGTLDYGRRDNGQVNAAMSRRTAGSALKPFIYAEAIDGGLICADTILSDSPLRYGGYTPGNYDGTFSYRVTAAAALNRSLNTPAIRLVTQLGPRRVLEMFVRLHLNDQPQREWETAELARKLGVSMALGTGGSTLLDMAAAFCALARGGKLATPSFLLRKSAPSDDRTVFTSGTCGMITGMLTGRPLPGCELKVAWKTGTSSGNRDAWCFAYTPEYTVGIWMGNKDGAGASALVGSEAAAPCAAAVIHALYRNEIPGTFDADGGEEPVELCAKTGLRARTGVCVAKTGRTVAGIPLRICGRCGRAAERRVRILKPSPGTYAARPDGSVKVMLQADAAGLHWYVDDVYVGQFGAGARIDVGRGHHCIRAVSEEEGVDPAAVELEVR